MRAWLLFAVRAFPRAFREAYGHEVVQVAEERCREAGAARGRVAAVRTLVREGAAIVRTGLGLRLDARRAGRRDARDLARELRLAARGLRRRPGFAAVTVGTLALGIGSASAVFSVVDAVLLKPLPYRDAGRLVSLFRVDAETGTRGDGMSAADLRDVGEGARLLEGVAVAEPWSRDLRSEGRTESLRAWAVSAGFFETLGVPPLLGRTFTPDEYVDGRDAVALLGHRAWVARFASDPDVVGRVLVLDDLAVTIVGVLPSAFRFPDRAELWVPRPPRPWDDDSRGQAYLTGVARLRPQASRDDVEAELRRIAGDLAARHPRSNADVAFSMVPLRDDLVGDARTPLLVLFGAVLLVLVTACTNVAALVAAQGTRREREYALRGALGAGLRRLVASVLAESFVLAGVGSAAGVGLAYALVAVLARMDVGPLAGLDGVAVDARVLGFGVSVGALSALLAAAIPGLRATRADLRGALVGGAKITARQGRRRGRLVAIQIAAAVVLLVGAGLLARSFAALLAEDLGFDPEGRIAVQLFLDEPDASARLAFAERVAEEMSAVPGVSDVAFTSELPGATDGVIARMDISAAFVVVGRDPPPQGSEPRARINVVSPGYFELMAIPRRAGRGFLPSDDAGATPVAVVNEAFAARHFPQGDVVGALVRVGYGDARSTREVVGVVRDVRPLGHASPPVPEIFLPAAQASLRSLTFVARAEGEVAALAAPLVGAVWAVDPSQPVWGAQPLDALLAEWLRGRRSALAVLSGFATVALALAMVGVYGLVSVSVEDRFNEIGIRRALGGGPRSIVGLVLRDGAGPIAGGLALGMSVGLYASRFLRGMLYGIGPTDPWTFAALGAAVLAVATLASLVPAARATSVDPVRVLRSE